MLPAPITLDPRFDVANEPDLPQATVLDDMKSLLTLVFCLGFATGLAASTPAAAPAATTKVFYVCFFGHHFPENVEAMKANPQLTMNMKPTEKTG